MKIVCINSVNYGSTGNIMLDVAQCAREHGHQVITASSNGRDMKKGLENHIFIGNRISRRLAIFLSQKTCLQGRFSFIATKRFIKRIKKFSPDIIHLHNLHSEYINLKQLFKYIKKENIKVIWTLHDCWAFTGRCAYFSAIKCSKWKDGCGNCPDLSKYPAFSKDRTEKDFSFKQNLFSNVKDLTLVTPSKWLADLTRQSFLKDYPVKVINNGINLNTFAPMPSDFREKYEIGNKKILLGVAFGWCENKGLFAFTELSKRLDSQKYQIVLVGTDDNVDKMLPSNIISIHRTQNQKQLAEIYTAADLFVNPTREEVLGLVNVEALACGTPVVTFKTGGSTECVDETCGSVVNKDDVEALEKEIIRICKKTPFNSQDCIKRAKNFDKNERFREYIDLYENGDIGDYKEQGVK